jgi:hypothetical protein
VPGGNLLLLLAHHSLVPGWCSHARLHGWYNGLLCRPWLQNRQLSLLLLLLDGRLNGLPLP